MEKNSTKENRQIQDIGLVLKDFLKVIKVVSLYPAENPLPQSMRQSFAEKLVSIVEENGDIQISVQRDHLTLDDETVFTDRSKEESLAGLFFRTGISSFTFKSGLNIDEIYRLLDVIKTYSNCVDCSEDLVNLIWGADMAGFSFTTIEDVSLADYDGDYNVEDICSSDSTGGLPVAGDAVVGYATLVDRSGSEHEDDRPLPEISAVSAGSDANFMTVENTDFEEVDPENIGQTVLDGEGIDGVKYRTTEAADAMGYADLSSSSAAAIPDTNMMFAEPPGLSDEDAEKMRQIVDEDAEFDMYESTAELLKELLHQEPEMNAFHETVSICEKVLGEFIKAGKLINAGQLLEYLHSMEDQIREDRPLWADRLKESIVTIGSRGRLKVLCETLNRSPEIERAELHRFLSLFGWEALEGLTDLLGDLEIRKHRETMCDYLAECGTKYPQIISKGLFDKRWFVVRNTVIVMCRIGDEAAFNGLKKIISHPEQRVRLALVESLQDCAHSEAIDLLKLLTRDRDPEVRLHAICSIVAQRGTAAYEAIVEILNDESFADMDSIDQQMLLNAFSELGGSDAIDYLTGLITVFNPLGGYNGAFFRMAAFEALSRNRSDDCETVLRKLSSSMRPDIKRQAIQALKDRRQLIYGAHND